LTAEKKYTTQLGAGLGLIEETQLLLELWRPGVSTSDLYQQALESGIFPGVTARRLRNIVVECFASRYLKCIHGIQPAELLQWLNLTASDPVFRQLLFLYTCRANPILGDFVREVYWNRYMGGYETISNEDASDFVIKANEQGKTTKFWSDTMQRRVAAYLTGCCADYGLLESGRKRVRKIQPFRPEAMLSAILSYDLRFAGLGDNAIVNHTDWELFGLESSDVKSELKRISLRGLIIFQAAADNIWLSWKFETWKELVDGLTES
jgi:hypothetical protein